MNKDLVSQITERNGESVLNIKVKLNAKKTELIYKNGLYAQIKSKAEKGRANRDLISLLKNSFKTEEVRIVSGHKSRKKLIKIGINKDEIISHLSRL